MAGKLSFEITSKVDIADLVDKIVEQSNSISDEDLQRVPKQYREFFKSALSSIVFNARHDGNKHYIDVFIPFSVGKLSKHMVDKMLGLSSRLKSIFKELNIDAKVKLL